MQFVGLETFRGGTLMSHTAGFPDRGRPSIKPSEQTNRRPAQRADRSIERHPAGHFCFESRDAEPDVSLPASPRPTGLTRVFVCLPAERSRASGRDGSAGTVEYRRERKRVRICRESPARTPRERATIGRRKDKQNNRYSAAGGGSTPRARDNPYYRGAQTRCATHRVRSRGGAASHHPLLAVCDLPGPVIVGR